MTQEEMMRLLERLRHAFQKFRSNTAEAVGVELSDEMLEEMFPWVFGPRCPLPAIQKCLDRGSVTGMEFYNFMVVLNMFCPEVAVADLETEFPAPDVLWCIMYPERE